MQLKNREGKGTVGRALGDESAGDQGSPSRSFRHGRADPRTGKGGGGEWVAILTKHKVHILVQVFDRRHLICLWGPEEKGEGAHQGGASFLGSPFSI